MNNQNLDTNENRLKSFFITYQKKILVFALIIIIIFSGYVSYNYYKNVENKRISENFNSIQILISKNQKTQIKDKLIEIIREKNNNVCR